MFGIKKVLFMILLSLVSSNAETIQTKSQEMISSPKGTFKDENTTNQSKAQVAQKDISSLNMKSNIINCHIPSCGILDNKQ